MDFPKIKNLCSLYELDGRNKINYVPSSLDNVKPIDEEMDGWESVCWN